VSPNRQDRQFPERRRDFIVAIDDQPRRAAPGGHFAEAVAVEFFAAQRQEELSGATARESVETGANGRAAKAGVEAALHRSRRLGQGPGGKGWMFLVVSMQFQPRGGSPLSL